MSRKELVERLRGFDMAEREMWEQTPIGRLCHEAADAIEALEQREAWWRELHAIVAPWYGEAGASNANLARVARAAELRRLLEVEK